MRKSGAGRSDKSACAALVAWYRRVRRPMPWRLKPTAYGCWLSEIMLQQTTFEQALPHYERFLKTFPTLASLAAAGEPQVLKAWEGLGYYARARNLLKAAKQIAAEGWPHSAAAWARLAGVGPYTAAALASVLDGEKVPVVDGNVARVFARFWRLADDFKKLPARQRLAARLQPLMCGKPGDFNQAMMELGQRVCTPREPACETCPLSGACAAKAAQCAQDYPVRAKPGELPVRTAQAVVIRDERGRVLLTRREEGGLLKGLWDLPRVEAAGDYAQTFSHFKLNLSLLKGVSAAAFAFPDEVPLTTAARKVIASLDRSL